MPNQSHSAQNNYQNMSLNQKKVNVEFDYKKGLKSEVFLVFYQKTPPIQPSPLKLNQNT